MYDEEQWDSFLGLVIFFGFFLPFEQRVGSGSFELLYHISFDCNLYSSLYRLSIHHPLVAGAGGSLGSLWAIGREGAGSLFQWYRKCEHFLALHLRCRIFPDPVWTHQCFSASIDPSFQCRRKNWEWVGINFHEVFPSNSQPPMGFPGRLVHNRPLSPNGLIYYFWIWMPSLTSVLKGFLVPKAYQSILEKNL